jgi:hypothetical protein
MATLNQQHTVLSNEDDEGSATAEVKNTLDWTWQSWPGDLRRAVIICTSIIVLLAAAIWLIEDQDQDFSQKLIMQTGQKSQAESKLRDSGKERNDIVKYLPVLRELEARSVYGEEKRLEWVEQLRAIEKRWPGISIKYDISPQKILPKAGTQGNPPPLPIGAKLPNGEPVKNFAVFSTDMKLTLSLLHEGDIFAIVDELKAAKLGLFTVKQCNFKRPSNADAIETPDYIGSALDVDCYLNWVSMNTYTP